MYPGKTDSAQEPQTYRGISSGFIMVNVLMNIILTKLSPFYENQLLTIQFCFRSTKRYQDVIYEKKIQENSHLSKRNFYTGYLDHTAMYDRGSLFLSISHSLSSSDYSCCVSDWGIMSVDKFINVGWGPQYWNNQTSWVWCWEMKGPNYLNYPRLCLAHIHV